MSAKFRNLIVLVMAVTMCMSLSGCGKNNEQDTGEVTTLSVSDKIAQGEKAIIGEWKHTGENGSYVLYSFNEDHTGNFIDAPSDDTATEFRWRYDEVLDCYIYTTKGHYVVACVYMDSDDNGDYLSLNDIKVYRVENGTSAKPQTETSVDINSEFVGTWKCKVLHEYVETPVYRYDGAVLNADGTGVFVKDIGQEVYEKAVEYPGKWRLDKEYNRVILETDLANIVFDVTEKDGETVLVYFSDEYCKE